MSAREWNRGLSRRRAAIFVFMLVYGVGLSSWVVRTPAVRDLVHATTAEMGLVLLGLSIGSMTGVLISAGIVRRHGVRLTVAIGGGRSSRGSPRSHSLRRSRPASSSSEGSR